LAGNRTKYYWRKYSLQEKANDDSYNVKRDQLAFEMAERGDIQARSVLQRIIARDPDAGKQQRATELLARLDTNHDRSELIRTPIFLPTIFLPAI